MAHEGAVSVAHAMPFGAQLLDSGGVRFRLWAPGCSQVWLEMYGAADEVLETVPMTPLDGGWHERIEPDARAGTLYRYLVAAGVSVPDPASRANPMGVHGPSEVVEPRAHQWQVTDWRGRPWHTAVLYELHVGTFTPEGDLDAAAARLGELAALGISAVQLMPLAAFAGERGWGYDGVLPFAVNAAYGRPDALKRFVDTAHGLDMMVLLDVVYNHFGPEGNHLSRWCPEFFNPAHSTPWGPAIDFDAGHSDTVRRYFVENALFWIEEYRLDGLRLDAVHSIRDGSSRHIVAEIAAALRDGPGRQREIHLVLENDDNATSLLQRHADGAPRTATAQWNDDLHHAAHVLATRETDGYYAGYARAPAALLGQALAEGFVYQGQACATRGGAARGESTSGLPPLAFVSFLQTHDQVGNRAFGERLDTLADPVCVEALLACLLLSPHVPMLFMGEEFAASTPFLYFCDFDAELARAVTEGRRGEFACFPAFAEAAARDRIPDPNAPETFAASKLAWAERTTPKGRRRLTLVTELLGLRRRMLQPHLPTARSGATLRFVDADAFSVEWLLGHAAHWTLRANFATRPVTFELHPDEQPVYRSLASNATAARSTLAPNGVEVTLRRAAPQ